MSLSAGSLVLDAEALYRELLRGVRSLMGPNTQLAGVASGGAWLAERLHKDLGLPGYRVTLVWQLHGSDSQTGACAAGADNTPGICGPACSCAWLKAPV